MTALQSISNVGELAQESIIKLVQRHVLKITVQALINAEWKRLGQVNEQNVSSLKRIHTPIGKIKIHLPEDEKIKFHSCVLGKKQRELSAPIEKFLLLPFIENEKLQTALQDILKGETPEDFIALFNDAMSDLFIQAQKVSLSGPTETVHLGSIKVINDSKDSQLGLLDYCITVDPYSNVSVAGIWDPMGRGEDRWGDICNELSERGLKGATRILTDGTAGLANIDARFARMEKNKEQEEFADPMADTIPFSIYDPPKVESQMYTPELRPSIEMTAALEAAHLENPMRLTSGALALSLVAVLFSVTGFYYFANGSTDPERKEIVQKRVIEKIEVKAQPVKAEVAVQQAPSFEQLALNPDIADDSLLEAIGQYGQQEGAEITPTLVRLAFHHNYLVRIAVAKALFAGNRYQSEEGMGALIRLLYDGDFLVRGYAAKILGKIGSPEAMMVLKARQPQEDNQVVRTVINKLLAS